MKSNDDLVGQGDRVQSHIRRSVVGMLGLGLLAPMIACGNREKNIETGIFLNVVAYNFMDRPILDILFNGEDLGVSGPFGLTGTITGVRVPFGIQKLTWRLDGAEGMPRLGDTVTARNQLAVREQDLKPDTRYIGLHLYQDETAELTFSMHIPELTARGKEIMRTKQSK